MQTLAGIVLAAGKGTRMKSELPKGLHAVGGLPMVELVGRAMKEAGVVRPILVIGHGGDAIREALGESYVYAWQHEQKGTGHAARMGADALEAFDGPVLIAPGDAPLLEAETLRGLAEHHTRSEAACTVATTTLENPTGYGRVIRDAIGRPTAIVEEKDASLAQREVREVAVSLYCFDARKLIEALPSLSAENAQGEYYLTDLVALLAGRGERVEAFAIEDPESVMGVNDRWQLAEAEQTLRLRILKSHALNGVTILDPATTYVGPDVRIGADTVLEPSTHLVGEVVVGSNCRLGPCTRIRDTEIGDGCYVYMSYVNGARLGEGVKIGPYANIRPESEIAAGVKIGNFVEIKKSTLGEKTAVSHLTYLGDAIVGAGANIGAGTIACNYDGFSKHRTTIGDGAFVGSNSTLVAPVTIGEGAIVGAGSVITQDVPSDALAIGRGRQEVKEAWATQWRKKKEANR